MLIWVLALFCGLQAPEATATTYNVFERIYEPETQPNDSIFVGTFDHDSVTHAVTNLKGILSESMTGGALGYPNDTMTWLTLNNQLVSWHDATLGGTFAAVFKNANTNTFWTGMGGDGWSPLAGVTAGGVYYGFPIAANNPGNAYALIFVPDNPLVSLTQAQIDKLAYADCAPGGMMGAVCMTGTSVAGYTAVGTMGGYPVEQVITIANTVPDPFSFISQTGVALNSVVESNAITVGGIAAASPISITGGEYSVSTDAGGSWSAYSASIPATVSNSNQVKVRLTSAAIYSTTTSATLTIGGVSGSFNVTTMDPPIDTMPDPFSFTPLTGVDPATVYDSNTITVTGINSPAAISVTGGSYAVSTDNGSTWGAWGSTAGTVALNNQVKVRVTSSATANTTVTATLTIGVVAANFSATTNQYNAPPTWMPMTMLNITLGAGNVLAIQDLSTKSPFNTVPPTYPVLSAVANTGTFDPAKPWAVLNGTAYSRRLGWNPGSGMNAAAIQAAFGPNAGIWIEKISSSDGLQTFQAVGSYGVNANNTTTIDPSANGYAPIFGTSGSSTKWKWDYMMDHNANAVPAAYVTAPNQHFSATYRLYIGDAAGNDIAPSAATTTTWGWTGPASLPANVPDVFSFTPVTGVATSTVITSNAVTLTGNVDPSLIFITGGEYSVSTDNGITWSAWSTSTPATVVAGNQVKVRLTSSALQSTTTMTTLTIGGVFGDFSVTTADTIPETFSFTPVTGAATAFATSSNAITVTGVSGATSISISGGTNPQYSVSTDGGATWSAWSATTPATVSLNNLVKVRQTSSTLPFTTTITTLSIGGVTGPFSVTTGYLLPPSWMPMSMLSVAFDGTALSVVDEATKLGAGVYPVMNYVAPGSYEPGKPWSILNGGVALSRQLGWDDPTAPHGNGIHVTGQVIPQVQSLYGADAGIWIECTSKSPGLETYFADGMYGVGGTGNSASGTPQVYTDANGFPIIYADNFYGIFGTDGSSSKWKWDGTMIHNVYAVPAAYITQPNQLFTATYRVYVGDNAGNDLAPAAATTEVWTWKGPATAPDNVPDQFSFLSQTGAPRSTSIESNVVTLSGLAVPSLVSITGGEYSVSTDSGQNWSVWSSSSPATVANGNQVKMRLTSSANYLTITAAILTVGGISASFEVTTIPQPVVIIPNVVGLTQASAQSAITAAGLTVGVITQAYSATVPAGSVISQNPAAGTSGLPSAAVSLVISKGAQPATVPNVVGKTQTAAQNAITAAGLTVGIVTQVYSATVPAGSVISQNPAAGTSVLSGTVVSLVVSKGKQSYRISGFGLILPEKATFPALFSLYVSSANLKAGSLAFYYPRKKLIMASTAVTSLECSNNVYTISGNGMVNGVKGYSYTATIVIGSPDSFGIVIKKANGSVAFLTLPKKVVGGDIKVSK